MIIVAIYGKKITTVKERKAAMMTMKYNDDNSVCAQCSYLNIVSRPPMIYLSSLSTYFISPEKWLLSFISSFLVINDILQYSITCSELLEYVKLPKHQSQWLGFELHSLNINWSTSPNTNIQL